MPSLIEILESAGRDFLSEKEIWCILYSAVKFLTTSSKDAGTATLVISPECLLIQKGQVKFVTGVQSMTSHDEFTAPEELEAAFTSSSLNDRLEKARSYSLGRVLQSVMDYDDDDHGNRVKYSGQLQSMLERMTEQDPEKRLGLQDLSQESLNWIESNTSVGMFSVQDVLEKLACLVSGEVESIGSELMGEHNLADEIDAVERSNRFSIAESGGSSISLSSRGSMSLNEDGTLSRSESHHSNVSDLRKAVMTQSSSSDHLKRDGESGTKTHKSQFYTPVRGRKTATTGDGKSSLPPLPRPPSISKNYPPPSSSARPSSMDSEISSSPLNASLTMNDFPPLPDPPHQQSNTKLREYHRDMEDNDELNQTDEEDHTSPPPKSLQQIQQILESNSAPDLLEVNKNDLFAIDDRTAETKQRTKHHEDTHNIDTNDVSMDHSIIAETTFDYTDMSMLKPNTSQVANDDEFQFTPAPLTAGSPLKSDDDTDPPPLPVGSPPKGDESPPPPLPPGSPPKSDETPPPLPLGSPPKSDETPPPLPLGSPPKSDETPPPTPVGSPPKSNNGSEEPNSPPNSPVDEDDSTHNYEEPSFANVDAGQVTIEKDEFGYTTVRRKLGTSPSKEQFEQVQTLDRTKHKIMKEEMIKAPSEGMIMPLPFMPGATLNPPERFSMPPVSTDPHEFEMKDVAIKPQQQQQIPTETSIDERTQMQTTSFIFPPSEIEQSQSEKLDVHHEPSASRQDSSKSRSVQFSFASDQKHSHSVLVHCPSNLEPNPLEVSIKPDSVCNELFERMVKILDIEERRSFGLSVIQNNEIIFMEPTIKVHKYAPDKKWRKKKSQPFRVYFRVMYFFKKPSLIQNSQARSIHYAQVKSDIVNGFAFVSSETQIFLAALALQADGKKQSIDSVTQYFDPQDYLSRQAIDDCSGKDKAYQLISQMHSKVPEMTSERATFCYLEEAMKTEEISMIFYQAKMGKKKKKSEPVLLGFSPNGILVCRKVRNTKEAIQHCTWKGTTGINSSNETLVLTVDGNDPLTLYTGNYKRAGYFVRMSRFYHQFNREMRDRQFLLPIEGLSDEEREGILKKEISLVTEYEGISITQKILKDETNSLGFAIKNHRSPINVNYGEVEKVTRDGPAYLAKFPKPGDLILVVNQVSMVGKKHSEIGSQLRKSASLIELTVFRRNEDPHSKFEYEGELLDVTLEKDQKLGLGCSLKNHISPQKVNYVQVTRIKDGGPADIKGCPKEGDLIVRLNGKNVVGMNHRELGQRLKNFAKIELQVLRVAHLQQPQSGHQTSSSKKSLREESIRTIEVQYTGDEELSSVRPLGPIIDLPQRQEQKQSTGQANGVSSSFKNNDSNDLLNEEEVVLSDQRKNSAEQSSSSGQQMGRLQSTTTLEIHSTVTSENGPALPMSPTELRTVVLRKKKSSFGFAISGRSNNPYLSVYINRITPGGAADESQQLNIGDHIVAVNGKSIEGLSYNEVFKLLRSLENEVQLQVCSPDDKSGRISVELDRTKGQIGIRIRQDDTGRTLVGSIVKGSLAEETGMIHEGDEILQINGTSLYGMSLREATDILMNSKSPVYILLRSTAASTHKFRYGDKQQPVLDEENEQVSDPAELAGGLEPDQNLTPSPKPRLTQDKKFGAESSSEQDKRPDSNSKPSPNLEEKTSPTPQERKPSPTQQKKSSPIQEKRPISIQGMRLSPMQEKRSSPGQEKKPSPIEEKRSSPMQKKRPSPMQERRLSPIQGKRSSPMQEKRLSPIQGKRSSPIQEKRLSPIQGKRSSPSPQSSPVQEKRSSSYSSPAQNIKQKQNSPLQNMKSANGSPKSSSFFQPRVRNGFGSEGSDIEYEKLNVSLVKGAKGFGFKIRKDPPAERVGKGLFIASIDYDPAKSDGRLKVGDEIIKINGESLIGVTHQAGVQTMRGVRDQGLITIQRKKDISILEEDVERKDDNYPSLKELIATSKTDEADNDPPEEDETALTNAISEIEQQRQQQAEEENKEEDTVNDEAPLLPASQDMVNDEALVSAMPNDRDTVNDEALVSAMPDDQDTVNDEAPLLPVSAKPDDEDQINSTDTSSLLPGQILHTIEEVEDTEDDVKRNDETRNNDDGPSPIPLQTQPPSLNDERVPLLAVEDPDGPPPLPMGPPPTDNGRPSSIVVNEDILQTNDDDDDDDAFASSPSGSHHDTQQLISSSATHTHNLLSLQPVPP